MRHGTHRRDALLTAFGLLQLCVQHLYTRDHWFHAHSAAKYHSGEPAVAEHICAHSLSGCMQLRAAVQVRINFPQSGASSIFSIETSAGSALLSKQFLVFDPQVTAAAVALTDAAE